MRVRAAKLARWHQSVLRSPTASVTHLEAQQGARVIRSPEKSTMANLAAETTISDRALRSSASATFFSASAFRNTAHMLISKC